MKTIRHEIKITQNFENIEAFFEGVTQEGFVNMCFEICSGITEQIEDNGHILTPGVKPMLIEVLDGIKNHPRVACMEGHKKFMLHKYIEQLFNELDKCQVAFIP